MRVWPTFPAPAHDLEFFKVMECSIEYLEFADSIRDDAVKEVANSFVENVKRTSSVCQSLQDLVYWCFRFGQRDVQIQCEIQARKQNGQALSPEETEAFYLEQLRSGFTALLEHINASRENALHESETAEEKTWIVFDVVAGRSPKISTALETMLWNMTTSYWTAFETLSGDLWVYALNKGSRTFANNAIQSRPPRNGDASIPSGQTESARDRYIAQLIDSDEELPYGTLLKYANKFSFMNVSSIQHAYGSAFRDKADTLLAEPYWHDLQVLEAVRHSLVHKAGVIDKMFIARAKKFPAPFTVFKFLGLPEGSKLQLNGPFVHHMHGCVTELGKKMIDFVDGVIA